MSQSKYILAQAQDKGITTGSVSLCRSFAASSVNKIHRQRQTASVIWSKFTERDINVTSYLLMYLVCLLYSASGRARNLRPNIFHGIDHPSFSPRLHPPRANTAERSRSRRSSFIQARGDKLIQIWRVEAPLCTSELTWFNYCGSFYFARLKLLILCDACVTLSWLWDFSVRRPNRKRYP